MRSMGPMRVGVQMAGEMARLRTRCPTFETARGGNSKADIITGYMLDAYLMVIPRSLPPSGNMNISAHT